MQIPQYDIEKMLTKREEISLIFARKIKYIYSSCASRLQYLICIPYLLSISDFKLRQLCRDLMDVSEVVLLSLICLL